MTLVENCTLDQLNFDEACVNVASKEAVDLWLYTLSSECVACPYSRLARIPSNAYVDIKTHTAKSVSWRVLRNEGLPEYLSAENTSDVHCELLPNFGEFGLYQLTVDEFGCDINTVTETTDPFVPLYIAVGAIFCILAALLVIKFITPLIRKKCRKRNDREVDEKLLKRRILSIDTIRGMSILFMIFVNDGAGGYHVLGHATWNGLLVGDLVFPCFMWVMGLCIPIALSSQLSRGVSRFSICMSIVKRSCLLFLIGISLNTLGTDARLENIRIFGVLQRFSIAYVTIALMYALKIRRKVKALPNSILRQLSDIVVLLPQWLVILIIVGVHHGISFYLPVPGCPTGYHGPGGRHADGKYFNCTGGAAGYIDRNLLGLGHIYQHLEIVTVYGSGPFDPEGMLGCLTSILQAFLGVQAGQTLLCHKDWKDRVTRWLSWALLLGCIGSVLHFHDVIPVNKNLWSLSFVFVTTCFCLALFSACYLLIDVVKVWHGGPFRIPGMNALVMYVGHQMCYQIFPFHWKVFRMNTHAWLLAESLWGVTLWTLTAYILHHKRIYINL